MTQRSALVDTTLDKENICPVRKLSLQTLLFRSFSFRIITKHIIVDKTGLKTLWRRGWG